MTSYKNPQEFYVEGSDITTTLITDIRDVLVEGFQGESVKVKVYSGELGSPESIGQLLADVAGGQQILVKYEETRHEDVDTRNTQIDERCFIGVYCCYANYSDFDLTHVQIGTIFQAVRRVMSIILPTRFDVKPSGSGNPVKTQARPEGVLDIVNIPGLVVQRPLFSFRYSTKY